MKKENTVKLDVTGSLKSFEGKVLKDLDEKGKECNASIRISIVNALLAHFPQDIGTVKLKKYLLAKRVFNNDEVELTEQEVQLITQCVMSVFPPMVIGGIYELIETAKR